MRLDRNQAGVAESVSLEISVQGSMGTLGEPKIVLPSAFSVISQSKSQKIEILNWQMTTSVIYTLVLSASQPGSFKLGPASLDAGGGKIVTSNILTLEILDQKQNQSPSGVFPVPAPRHKFPRTAEEMVKDKERKGGSPQSQSFHEPKTPPQPPGQENQPPPVFIEAQTEKKEAFVGEGFKFSVLFYTRVPFLSQPQYAPPAFSGFWNEDLPQKNFTASRKGTSYQVTEIPVILFPTSAGKLSIGSAKVQVQMDSNPEDPFAMDPFDPQFIQKFLGMGTRQPQTLESSPLTITAKPLPPEGKPSYFSGALGDFKIEAEVDKKDIKVGESLALTVIISGEGNIRSLPSPIYPNLDGLFRSYETEKSETISKEKGTISGKKTFKLLLIPQVPGQPTLTIPPIQFAYFDPKLNTYREIKTSPLSIKVSGEPIKQLTSPANAPREAKKFGDDINDIIEEVPSGSPFERILLVINKTWPITGSVPIVFGLFALAFETMQKRKMTGRKKPLELLEASLKQAQRLNQSNRSKEAIHLACNSFESGLGLLLGLGVSEITTKALAEAIAKRCKNAVSPQEVQALENTLQNIHFLQYAPLDKMEAEQAFSQVLGKIRAAKKILEKI